MLDPETLLENEELTSVELTAPMPDASPAGEDILEVTAGEDIPEVAEGEETPEVVAGEDTPPAEKATKKPVITVSPEKLKKILALTAAGLLVLTVLCGIWSCIRYVMVDGTLYPRNEQVLDLRDRDITPEIFAQLQRKLPKSKIVWNVAFQGGSLPSNTETVTVTSLADADVAMMDYFTDLKTVDATACTDYPQLLSLQQKHPECTVKYLVRLSGTDYPQDAVSIAVPDLTAQEAELLAYLPRLTSVDATGCTDYTLLISLRQAYPDLAFSYSVTVSGTDYPHDTTEITASGATGEEVANALTGLTQLKSLHLTDPQALGCDLVALREQYPEVSIRWELNIGETVLPDDTVEADLSGRTITSVEEGKQLASYFPQAEKVIYDSGSIPNEDMAAFREEMRSDYKVVWTVIMGTGKRGQVAVRTDETTFMPYKHRIIYFLDEDLVNLRYCEDMICMDLGHFTFKSIEFVAYMPHLKYLVLTLTDVRDLTPISNCKELVFLELGHTGIKDLSPLIGCTALEDLNLGQVYADPEPLKQMPWLKNIWWVYRSMAVKQELEPYLPNTYLMFRPQSKDTTSFGWRQLPNYYAMRDLLEMPYMR